MHKYNKDYLANFISLGYPSEYRDWCFTFVISFALIRFSLHFVSLFRTFLFFKYFLTYAFLKYQ